MESDRTPPSEGVKRLCVRRPLRPGSCVTEVPHRPLREETLAELAGVKPNLVKKWVDDLSLLYIKTRGPVE